MNVRIHGENRVEESEDNNNPKDNIEASAIQELLEVELIVDARDLPAGEISGRS